jgi:hypothetical protein
MSDFKKRLWRELVREHGAQLEQISRELTGRPRLPRARLVAGAGLGLAGSAAALAIVLGTTSTTPAFAVIRNADGTVTVRIARASGIATANARLAALGIRARAVAVASGCTNVPTLHGRAWRIGQTPNGTPRAMRLAQTYVAQARIDPRKIPPGRIEVIPAWRVHDRIVLATPRAVRGAAPDCLPWLLPPPCEVARPAGHIGTGISGRSPAKALARARALAVRSATQLHTEGCRVPASPPPRRP